MTDQIPPPPPPPVPPGPSAGWPPAPSGATYPEVAAPIAQDAPVARSRGKGGRVGFVVGLVALVALVGAGLATMLGSGGGAGSAEDAVRGLAEAAAEEDIVGAAQYLPPSEIGSAPDLYDLVIKVLQKNDELGPAGKPLAGVDITVDDLELETTMLSKKVGKVELVSGTFGTKVTAAEVDPRIRESADDPIEDSTESVTVAELRDQLVDGSSQMLGERARGEISGLFLVAVEQDGKWYVSYQYTLLEYARELVGADLPAFGESPRSEGTSDPEGLLTTLVEELNGIDAERIADAIEAGRTQDPSAAVGSGLVNPRETQALLDYLPIFEQLMTEVQGAAGFRAGDQPNEIAEQLRQFDISVQASAESEVRSLADGRSMVVLRSAEITASVKGEVDGELVDVELNLVLRDGTCAEVELIQRDARGRITSNGDKACADVFDGTEFRGFFFVAVKVDGSWYLSPVETAVQYVRYALEAELAR